MFKTVQETDKYGKPQTRYYLTQGDSLVIYATPWRDGEVLPVEQVEKCTSKLSNLDYEQEFVKDMPFEDGKFVLRLTSEETKQFSVDTHIYEIEYTLLGGAVQTPNQWKFNITDQIVL